MNLKGARSTLVLAVDRLPELRGWDVGDEAVRIGAGLTLIALGAVPMGVWHWRRPGTASPLQSTQIQERRG